MLRLDRRTFLAMTSGLALCGGRAFAQSQAAVLTVASYGGVYQDAQNKAFFEPFLKANSNVQINNDTTSSNAKLRTMVESGQVTWDIAVVSDDFGFDEDGEWLEPIDYDIIPKDRFYDGLASKYRVSCSVEATVIAHRTDALSEGPKNFVEFFDLKNFPGNRAVYKYVASGLIEGALLADGVAPADLYPIDMDRALSKLDTIKGQLIWWETGAQSGQLMVSGEASVGLLWVGRAVDAATKAPVAVDWGQWIPTNGYWVVPKGAPNKDLAMKAIAAFTEAESQRRFGELLSYGPSNKNVVMGPDAPFAGNYPTDHLDTVVPVDFKWWRDNLSVMDRKFQQWLIT